MSDTRPVEDLLLLERKGAVAEIVINNPARHNAMSLSMWERLASLLDGLAGDPSVRVLVMRGAGGKAFAAGADISRFESERATAEASRHYNAMSTAASSKLYNFPRPTIARINGYCIGGGLALALCCDLRIAAEDSTFAIPAARLGLGYGLPGVERLVDLVGPSAAMDIFVTARRLRAEEALRIGLVNRVVPVDDLEQAVADATGRICENAPLTIAAAKAAIRELAKEPHLQDRAAVARMVDACFASDDFKEGRRAFMEKRAPRFQGK